LPITISRKNTYADDLAIMHADGIWQAGTGVLSKDMATVGDRLEAKAQHYKNGVNSIPSQQQESSM